MQDSLLIVISCKIQKQIIYFQHIMSPNTDYHSQSDKSGHSEKMMSQSKTERQQRKFQTL